jgi:hypothetical protein
MDDGNKGQFFLFPWRDKRTVPVTQGGIEDIAAYSYIHGS